MKLPEVAQGPGSPALGFPALESSWGGEETVLAAKGVLGGF